MHLINDINPLRIKGFVRAVVEISMGSRQKYEVDPEYGILTLDRSLPTACRYPMNYGFVPRTLGVDGDPLDIFLFSRESILPGTLVTARPIAIFDLKTDGESDHKIISVVKSDPEYGQVQKIEEMPSYVLAELTQFLLTYKQLENKQVKVGEMRSADQAWKMIYDSLRNNEV